MRTSAIGVRPILFLRIFHILSDEVEYPALFRAHFGTIERIPSIYKCILCTVRCDGIFSVFVSFVATTCKGDCAKRNIRWKSCRKIPKKAAGLRESFTYTWNIHRQTKKPFLLDIFCHAFLSEKIRLGRGFYSHTLACIICAVCC